VIARESSVIVGKDDGSAAAGRLPVRADADIGLGHTYQTPRAAERLRGPASLDSARKKILMLLIVKCFLVCDTGCIAAGHRTSGEVA
jgi:hypothetical protein